MSSEPLSALVVPFPEFAPVLDRWLERSEKSKPSHGVPPHVTLLYPCPAHEAGMRELLEPLVAFDVEFRELRRFEDAKALYLAPGPPGPFVAATEALAARFPDWPPYGGAYETVVPHLTVTVGDGCDEAETAVAPVLPLQARAREAVLLSEVESRRWVIRARFPFREA